MSRASGSILALDPGERRIGVAISDELGMLARPLEVIVRRAWAVDLRRLELLVREHGVERIVVGWPISTSGERGPAARRAERFAARVADLVPKPVELWDERYSTMEARLLLRQKRRAKDAPVDAAAAAVMLQHYLDEHR